VQGIWRRGLAWGLALWVVLGAGMGAAQAQDKRNWAPGFTGLTPDAKVLVAPLDVELFIMTAGGSLEPRADWTEAAQRHMKAALGERAKALRLGSTELSNDQADEMAELLALQGAVARAVAMHHVGFLKLPTKEEKLDWHVGDVFKPLQQATGARYALFTWVRDSYASAERKAMMVGMALLGVGLSGGIQVGYATLVDLDTGRVLWFNQSARASGDLREAEPARESVKVLLSGFPEAPAAKP